MSTVLPVRTHRIGIISPELIYSLNGEFMENNNSKATRPTTGDGFKNRFFRLCHFAILRVLSPRHVGKTNFFTVKTFP